MLLLRHRIVSLKWETILRSLLTNSETTVVFLHCEKNSVVAIFYFAIEDRAPMLLARSPVADHFKQVGDIDDAVAVYISR
jgi:hypothetical protein